MAEVIEAMDREGRIPNSDNFAWEDKIIAQAQENTAKLAAAANKN
jgi:hypothetical protein